jgi:hypothetical protein
MRTSSHSGEFEVRPFPLLAHEVPDSPEALGAFAAARPSVDAARLGALGTSVLHEMRRMLCEARVFLARDRAWCVPLLPHAVALG